MNLPAIFVCLIKYKANGNLINKLAAITFLLPLLPTIVEILDLFSTSETMILNWLITYSASKIKINVRIQAPTKSS